MTDNVTSLLDKQGTKYAIPKWIKAVDLNPESVRNWNRLYESLEDAGMHLEVKILKLARQRNDSIIVHPVGGIVNNYIYTYKYCKMLFFPKQDWNQYNNVWGNFGNPVKVLETTRQGNPIYGIIVKEI